MGPEIDRETLQRMRTQGESFTLVDTRSAGEYDRLHIAGAVSMPSQQVAVKARQALRKDETIVVYCTNPACEASTIAQEKLGALGYENVYHYGAGIEEWMKAGLAVEGSLRESGQPP